MKLRTGDPWMPAADYGRTLRGVSLNLLVTEIDSALRFHREVLGAELVYADPDFAVLRGFGAEWMLHADHTYLGHPVGKTTAGSARRGAGLELRVHGRDPDVAEAAARRLGFEVLLGAADTGHGVREVFLADGDGYIWVPDIALP